MDPALAISLEEVRKTYGRRVKALLGVDLHVRAGEIFGLLGPNGAGKSTLVKVMLTIVRADAAKGTLLGRPLGDLETLGSIGYLPEHHRLPPYLSGRQVIEFSGAMSKVPRRARKARAHELLDRVGMASWGDRPLATYSKGMKQRVGLAAALVNDPKLVVLDEPTDGVDPVGRKEFRDLIVQLRGEGRTVMLNSHLLAEVEMVCARVAIMVQGRVAAQGTIDELTASSRRYEIVIEGGPPAWCDAHTRVEALAPGSLASSGIAGAGTRLSFLGIDAAAAQPILDKLRVEGRTIVGAQSVRESLEDLFMRAVTDPTTGLILKPGAVS
jgi:ABC-2 type transport system ATP-binding protein